MFQFGFERLQNQMLNGINQNHIIQKLENVNQTQSKDINALKQIIREKEQNIINLEKENKKQAQIIDEIQRKLDETQKQLEELRKMQLQNQLLRNSSNSSSNLIHENKIIPLNSNNLDSQMTETGTNAQQNNIMKQTQQQTIMEEREPTLSEKSILRKQSELGSELHDKYHMILLEDSEVEQIKFDWLDQSRDSQ
ncbi:Hypothetical_protein [Hexamita inflata]|uniref:Hypothetical_protein n=1 Tax=Hexamita inflata TaxID=28002 RepID=A0AA86PSQ6_9EUKA|nr:Hypothetical protein HINF_LOCUS33275 [Hexamita inflata]